VEIHTRERCEARTAAATASLVNAVVRRWPAVPGFAFPFRHRFRGQNGRSEPLESAPRREKMILRRLSANPGCSPLVAAPGAALALLNRVVPRAPSVPIRAFPNGLIQRRLHCRTQPENAAGLGKGVIIGRTMPLLLAVIFANAELAVHSLIDIVVTRLEFVPPPASPSAKTLGIHGERPKPGQPAQRGEILVMCGGFSGWHDWAVLRQAVSQVLENLP
jgi:hypothetical protein